MARRAAFDYRPKPVYELEWGRAGGLAAALRDVKAGIEKLLSRLGEEED